MLVRKALILVSLASVFFLSAGLIIPILSVLAHFVSWSPGLEGVGGIFLLVAFIFLAVYYVRQGRAITRQVKQRGIAPLTRRDIFHNKTVEAKPYLREVRIGVILVAECVFFVLVMNVADFIISYTIDSSYSSSPGQQIQKISALVYLLTTSASILVYAILSKDFTKNQRQELKNEGV